MIGRTISHYEIIEKLGEGGMGVVYKAHDTKLERTVALKFLPQRTLQSEEERKRITREAQAAASLNHANIATVYEIDEVDEHTFIAMEYIDGIDLSEKIRSGPLPVNEAIDIAIEIAKGLQSAHEKGVVHRDIKGSNVMMTEKGEVKLMDFGLAKMQNVSLLTKEGSTLGTVPYMSPEQAQGEEVDHRTDIWSLGVLIYEMITGKRPFRSEYETALVYLIINEDPEPLKNHLPDISSDIVRIVNRAFEKEKEKRYTSAAEMLHDLKKYTESLKQDTGGSVDMHAMLRRFRKPQVAVPAALVIIAIIFLSFWYVDRQATRNWVHEVAIPEIEEFVRIGSYDDAWTVARHALEIAPDEPDLTRLLPRISVLVPEFETDPPGVQVHQRLYGDTEDPWEDLGTTPLDSFRIPFPANSVLRFERDGYRTVYRVPGGLSLDEPLFVTLDSVERLTEGVVRIPGWRANIDGETVDLGDFFMNRYPVTNLEYKRFVDAGGYHDPQYCEHPFVLEGDTLSWEEAMARFTDRTGRPGPGTWEVGSYPEGQEDYPVGGVSWYEAAAYAKFAGKSLPSVHHWRRAYGSFYILQDMVPLANLQSEGPEPVGKRAAMAPFGTFDMAGNVREWCWNEVAEYRYILGGGWNDPQYMASGTQTTQPAFNRSPANGIRLVAYPDNADHPGLERALQPVEPDPVPDYREMASPPSDDVFKVYRAMFAYDPTPLEPRVEAADTARNWVRQTISFDAAYGGERMLLHLYLPKASDPPMQTVVYWPGAQASWLASIDQGPAFTADFIVRSGRAVAFPVLKGTLERQKDRRPAGRHGWRDRRIQQLQDLMRTIDYLETRDDLDTERLVYYGISWGGGWAPLALSLEPRFHAAVLHVAGLWDSRPLPEVDPLNYLSRVELPVLMVSGRLDAVFPLETHARPFFDLLGTAPEDKRFFVFEGGHVVPRRELIRETLDWLDRYQGPV